MLSVDGGEIKCKVWRWGATQRKQTLISNILFYRLNDSLREKKKKKNSIQQIERKKLRFVILFWSLCIVLICFV